MNVVIENSIRITKLHSHVG